METPTERGVQLERTPRFYVLTAVGRGESRDWSMPAAAVSTPKQKRCGGGLLAGATADGPPDPAQGVPAAASGAGPSKRQRCEGDGQQREEAVSPSHDEATGMPVMKLTDLLLHRHREGISTDGVRSELWNHLERHGFVVLSFPVKSEVGTVVNHLQETLSTDFFPTPQESGQSMSSAGRPTPASQNQTTAARNVAKLGAGQIYVSERGVPMWKLGYECSGSLREFYRVHAGSPDSQPWPTSSAPVSSSRRADLFDDESSSTSFVTSILSSDCTSEPRRRWLRALALCRHICDEALSLTLNYDLKKRQFGSGFSSWRQPRTTPHLSGTHRGSANRPFPGNVYYLRPERKLPERCGDKSVMYAMHYFNDDTAVAEQLALSAPDQEAEKTGKGIPEVVINVKAHVDPSLFVLEPFLADVEGLQVQPSPQPLPASQNDDGWISCDGPLSPIHNAVRKDDGLAAMVLFVGRAFAIKALELTGRTVTPTLHRVIGPHPSQLHESAKRNRRTIIYEQKYEEYFPPPILD